MIGRLTETLNFNAQALMLRAERQSLIAGNIANADTPGYLARDVSFAQALRDATSPAMASRPVNLDPSGQRPSDAQAAFGQNLVYASPSQSNLDGNTVDLDRERASLAENAIKYESTLRFINGQVRTMLDAMKSYNSG